MIEKIERGCLCFEIVDKVNELTDTVNKLENTKSLIESFLNEVSVGDSITIGDRTFKFVSDPINPDEIAISPTDSIPFPKFKD